MRRLLASCLALLVLPSCDPSQQAAEPVDIFPVVRAELDAEWRNALEIPPGEVRVNLGRAPLGGVVRLGVLPVDQDEALVEVRVDRWKVAEVKADDRRRWHDARIELGAFTWVGGQDCTLVCRSANGIRLGPCELIKPDTAAAGNVLIVVLDTVRSDHLSCYGYPEPTSPAIDRLAADGVLFYRLMPQSSWTRPSVASLLTSTYPPAHGAEERYDPVRPGLPGLAEALNGQGYASLGVVTNPNCLPVWGLGNGFARYVSFATGKAPKQANDAAAVDAALDGIANLAGRPWFVYLHLMAAHRPYTAPPVYASRFRPNRFVGTRSQRRIQKDLVLYDGEIACADDQVGRLIDFLKRIGCYDQTLIILLSDHGEQFFEHGEQGHGMSLYDEELRVPLIVKLPGSKLAGERRRALVEMVDVAPTALDVLGLHPEPRFQGRSFAGIIQQDRWEARAGFASLRLDGESQRTVKNVLAKYTVDDTAGLTYWFNLEKDPDELRPLFAPTPEGAHFDELAARMSVEGAPGLHLSIRPGPSPNGILRVWVSTKNPAAFTFYCPADCGQAASNDGIIEATVDLAKLAQAADELTLVRSDWAPYAHLLVPAPSQETVAVRVECGGEPLAEKQAFLGPDGRHAPLDGQPLNLADLACDPIKPPSPGNADFALCVWWVSTSGPLAPDALTKETTEALNALGYIQ